MPQGLLSAPSTILAILTAAVVLRAVYELIAGSGGPGIVARRVCLLTHPGLLPPHAAAPPNAPTGLIYLFALCWLIAARMVWFVVSAALGLWAGTGA